MPKCSAKHEDCIKSLSRVLHCCFQTLDTSGQIDKGSRPRSPNSHSSQGTSAFVFSD